MALCNDTVVSFVEKPMMCQYCSHKFEVLTVFSFRHTNTTYWDAVWGWPEYPGRDKHYLLRRCVRLARVSRKGQTLLTETLCEVGQSIQEGTNTTYWDAVSGLPGYPGRDKHYLLRRCVRLARVSRKGQILLTETLCEVCQGIQEGFHGGGEVQHEVHVDGKVLGDLVLERDVMQQTCS